MGRGELLDEALPVAPRGGAAGTSAHMSDLELHREKNRLAQTRFRARRKNQIQVRCATSKFTLCSACTACSLPCVPASLLRWKHFGEGLQRACRNQSGSCRS